jgi:MFS family permease
MAEGRVAPPRPLPLLGRLLPNVYYGWFVTGGIAAALFVGVGIGFYSQTLLLDGLSRAHGWSKASLSGAASVYFVTSALYGAVVGRAADRYGARRFLAAGAFILAATLLATAAVTEIWHLYVIFPVMSLGF